MSDREKVAQPNLAWPFPVSDEETTRLIHRADRIARTRQDLDSHVPQELGAVGYIARAFIACTLPHSDPRVDKYVRENGPYRLTLLSTRGVPFGKVPRVLIAYIQTEVVRTREREILLGRTLTEAVERLRLHDGGSTLRAVSGQLHRTVGTTFEIVFDDARLHDEISFKLSSRFRYRYDLPKQVELWNPTVTVSEDLYRELVRDDGSGGVPFDWRMVRALRSPLAIDLYLWATHTTWRVRDHPRTLKVPLDELHLAFGTGLRCRENFRTRLTSALSDVRALWPDVPLALVRGALAVEPGRPHVQPTPRTLPPGE